MISTIKQAQEVQARRVASGKKGVASAVKRFFHRNSSTYTTRSVVIAGGRGVMERTTQALNIPEANKCMKQALS